jgi:DNA invertase Pin-like site-specific DNA recombinase
VAELQEARRRGIKLGRRPVTFDVTRARQMRAAGLSYAAVARELGVATGTVHAALSAAQ